MIHGLGFLNAHSATFLATQAWPMVWQSSLLVVLVAVAGRTVFRKARAQLRYWLWGLVLLRLLVPPSFDLPTSIGHWGAPVAERHAAVLLSLDRPASETPSWLERPLLSGTNPMATAAGEEVGFAASASSSAHEMPRLSPATVVLLAWVGGMTGLVLLLVFRLARFRRILRHAEPPSPAVQALVAECQREMGVRWPVEAREVDAEISPALYGLWRPRILLPRHVTSALDTDQLRAVIVHELAHAKRGDFLVNWLQIVLGMVYFFHPLVWFTNRQMRKEREQACDDLALVTLQLNRDGYAESLVQVAERFAASGRFATAYMGVVETKTHLGARVRRILDKTLKPAPRLSLICVATVLVFAALFGTWRRSEAAPEGASKPAATPEKPVVAMLPLEVRVVDEAGKPVEGAEVEPYALRTKSDPGSHYGWREDFGRPTGATTNQQGIARIRYPKYAMERIQTDTVSVSVSHKQFVPRREDVSVDGSSPAIILVYGTTMRVSGYVGDENNIVWPVHAVASGSTGPWGSTVPWQEARHASQECLENNQFLPGQHSVWLAYRPKDGPVLFSDAVQVETARDRIAAVVLALHPGVRLEGRLDDQFPRPTKDGRVEVRVSSVPQEELKEGRPEFLLWTAQTTIKEDGTFAFDSLPEGYGEIAVWCDGGMVSYHPKNASPRMTCPYPVSLRGAVCEAVVPMTATATAVVQVEDPDGRPIQGVSVSFWPNIVWLGRMSTIAWPSGFDTLQWLEMGPDARKAPFPSPEHGFEGVTGADGQVTIHNLPPGETAFAVMHDAYEMPLQTKGVTQRRQQDVTLAPGTETAVVVRMQPKGTQVLGESAPSANADAGRPDATTATCNAQEKDPFALPTSPTSPRNRFEGQVVGEDGKPLAGVRVDAWTWFPRNETETDAEGNFALDGFDLEQKEIEVRFTKEGHSPVYMFRQPLGRLTGPLVMTTKTYLEGKVTDSRGRPVPNAIIRADGGPRQADGVSLDDTMTQTTSRADGAYRFYVQHGAYKVTATSGKEMMVLNDVVIGKGEAKPLNIQLASAPTFRAKVVDSVSKAPVPGVRLYSWRFKEIEGTSSATGEIEITGIPAGKFEFQVDGEKQDIARWWSEDAVNAWQRYAIDDEKLKWQRNFDDLQFEVLQAMKPVTVVVEKGAHIRGKVVAPDGTPVPGATVAPARTGTGNSLTGDTRFSVRSGEDGTFDMLLPASKASTYNLIAHDGDYDEWRTWANGVMEPLTTQPGDLKEGVILQVQPPCVVRGKVADAQGRPVAQREVRACAFDMTDNRYYVPTVRTDKDGLFELKYVAPGKHFIQAAPFWLTPSEAPEGTSQTAEVTPDKPVEGIILLGRPE